MFRISWGLVAWLVGWGLVCRKATVSSTVTAT